MVIDLTAGCVVQQIARLKRERVTARTRHIGRDGKPGAQQRAVKNPLGLLAGIVELPDAHGQRDDQQRHQDDGRQPDPQRGGGFCNLIGLPGDHALFP